MQNTFTIKTGFFEGPLELLLDLIERRKLLINDVSLASVTDDFLAYIKQQQELPVAQTANFILVASTLLLIKSKSLLPVLELTEEEEGSIRDLEERLRLYKRFKELSKDIQEQFGREMLFARSPLRDETPIFSPDLKLSVPLLHERIRGVLLSLPKKQFIPKAVVEKVISLEEMIERLSERVTGALRMSFKEFAGVGKAKKVDVIVSFLAMLELVKRGAIGVTQDEHFSDIAIESNAVSIPKYH